MEHGVADTLCGEMMKNNYLYRQCKAVGAPY